MSTIQQPDKKKAGAWVWAIVIGFFAIFFVIGMIDGNGDSDTTVPVPAAQESTDLVARLAEAEQAHGICYGWELYTDDFFSYPSDTPKDMGSSRGKNISARDCDKWAIMQVGVEYTSASSSLEDDASVSVVTSPGLPTPTSTDLDRMGINQAAALNAPAATVGLGALALPLLLAEEGAVEPLPATGETVANPPTPLGSPGSDFASNNSGAIIALSIIGGLAVLSLVIGLIIRSKRGKEAR